MNLPKAKQRQDGMPSMSPTLEKDTTSEQVLENRGRIAIFIDGASLFYSAYQLGIEIDYVKLLCRLTDGSRLLRAFFYTGIEFTNEKQQRFLQWMQYNGYRVVAKEVAQLADGSKKVNLDVEIAVDLMALAPFYDTAVLVSGKGELAYAANAVSYRGVRVELMSLRSMTSDSLLDVCDRYIDMESIKEDIKKTSNPSDRANSNTRFWA
ncbi:MAG: NYN domain-containing protein [Coleofasciculaceae cyanobacterium]